MHRFPKRSLKHISLTPNITKLPLLYRGICYLSHNKNLTYHNTSRVKNLITTNNMSPLLTKLQSYQFSSQYPEHEIVGLPALSPSVEVSTIVSWKKKVGDYIEEDETIASVQTDKAELDWKVTDAVYLAKILLEPGKEVPIGTPCAIFVENKNDVNAFNNYKIDNNNSSDNQSKNDNTQSQQQKQQNNNTQSSSIPSNLPEYKIEGLPALSPTATDGAVVQWLVKEGDLVEEGSGIAEIQTDKSVVTFQSTDELYVAKLLVDENADNKLPVGTPIIILVDNKNDIKAFQNIDKSVFLNNNNQSSSKPTSSKKEQQTLNNESTQQQTDNNTSINNDNNIKRKGDRIFISPLAKRLAKEKNIDISLISTASGSRSRIISSDLSNIKQPTTKQDTTTTQTKQTTTKEPPKPLPLINNKRDIEKIAISTMRNVIASRLSESKNTSPHFYVTISCEIDKLIQMRKDINENNNDIKISVNDFIIKACALALKDCPNANQSWMNDYIAKYNYVDISVAVATPTGLITPIIKDANLKGLNQISSEMKYLAYKAKENKLTPDEFQGGTFTISNMGMYGVNNFTAIINPPQSCILAVSAARQVLKPDINSEKGFRYATVMNVCLSSDHRSVDGAVAAQWCNAFKKYMEYPAKMLL